MRTRRPRRPSRLAIGAAALAFLTSLALTGPAAGLTAPIASRDADGRASVPAGSRTDGAAVPGAANLDVRDRRSPRQPAPAAAAARHDLAAELGILGAISIDPRTGTPDSIMRRDGFLTGRSADRPAQIALAYVRAHLVAFGLDEADLASLGPVQDYVDILGTHHLTWAQLGGGVPVYENHLAAAVTADGRLAMIGGAPVHGLGARAPTVPRVSPSGAIARVRASAGATATAGAVARTASGPARATTFTNGDDASLVLFEDGDGLRTAWHVHAAVSSVERYDAVVDALTGRILRRTNTVYWDDVAGSGLAWQYYPSDLVPAGGGTQQPVTFPVEDATALSGNNAHAYKDVFDDSRPDPEDDVPASGPGPDWSFPAVLNTTSVGQHCSTAYACTWSTRVPYSWRENIRQDTTQLYYYLNAYHDHLLAPPIGFTEAAGNFQVVNGTGLGEGGDPVEGQADDGANTRHGFPDFGHIWNANISLDHEDGGRVVTQMYLFPANVANDTAPSGNAGDDGSVVYHEYTHGLSIRLLPNGYDGFFSAAMGEAWSDWYALDFLAKQGYEVDDPGPGDVITGGYIQGGVAQPVRSEPMDCPVGTTDPVCPGGEDPATGPGGYTLGDIGEIAGYPEVHADGEIWSQTLWQLRSVVGSDVAESVVTRAMELSGPNPTFLDERNAILLADQIAFDGAHADDIWAAFASRGMGYFAEIAGDGGFFGLSDVTEDFSLPPVCPGECAKISGTITDAETGAPLAGAEISIPLAFGLGTRTEGDGSYVLRQVPVHTYPTVTAVARGYEPLTFTDVEVGGPVTLDAQLHRDWAARISGGHITSVTGPAYRGRCSPRSAIDLRFDTGWITQLPRRGHRGHAIVIRLPKAIDVSSFAIDPAFGCFTPFKRAAVKVFRIETRTAHGSWVTAYHQVTQLPPGELSTLVPRRGARHVQAVRLTMIGSRDGSITGMVELSVRGLPSP